MEIQSDLNMMNMWSDDAAQQFKIVVDREVLLSLLGQAAPEEQGHHRRHHLRATSTSVSPARHWQIVARNPAGTAGKVEIVDLLVRLGQVLDEQNIPETGRWVVLPAWISSQIKMSELRDASLTGRLGLDPAERQARHGRSLHDLRVQPAAVWHRGWPGSW